MIISIFFYFDKKKTYFVKDLLSIISIDSNINFHFIPITIKQPILFSPFCTIKKSKKKKNSIPRIKNL